MSISTYAELQTAVKNWMARSDLDSIIPDFIALAEVRMFRGENPVRVSAMQTQDTGTIASQIITLPTSYLETIRLAVTSDGQNYALEYIDPVVFSTIEEQSGNPQFYTVINNQLKTAPDSSLAYIHDYYAAFDPLATTSTNWLLTNAPNVYLYGALLEAALYTRDEGMAANASQLFEAAKSGINKAERRKYQSASMSVKVA
jgi:hypothetical protein